MEGVEGPHGEIQVPTLAWLRDISVAGARKGERDRPKRNIWRVYVARMRSGMRCCLRVPEIIIQEKEEIFV